MVECKKIVNDLVAKNAQIDTCKDVNQQSFKCIDDAAENILLDTSKATKDGIVENVLTQAKNKKTSVAQPNDTDELIGFIDEMFYKTITTPKRR